uniref:RING-type E3 ubiquitin transferase n=1 Tax=Solanum tuberosum TaxID=4113 RepID=M1D8L7_SOLTU
MVNFRERRHHFATKTAFFFRPELRWYNDNNNSNGGNIRSDLPNIVLQYNLFAQQDAWRKSPVNQPSKLIYLDEFHEFETRSFELKLCPYQYTSHDVFFSILKEHLTNWGDYYEVSDDYLIKRMIFYMDKIIGDGLKKGRGTNCQIFVDMTLKLEYVLDGRVPWRLSGGMVPATKTSIMELPVRMEIDDDVQCLKDIDCVICLEQLVSKKEGGKIVCMPCSHMFHGNCIITWLDMNHYCPICRYDLPTP